MRRDWAVVLLVALAASANLGACADATGTVSGGERRFDAAPPLADICLTAGPGHDGITWTELYKDYFGGAASCSLEGTCHGDATGSGVKDSNFICPKNDKDACFKGLGEGVFGSAPLVNTADPTKSGLYLVLRKSSGGGKMPKKPQCTFGVADMKRITDWMTAGAKND